MLRIHVAKAAAVTSLVLGSALIASAAAPTGITAAPRGGTHTAPASVPDNMSWQ